MKSDSYICWGWVLLAAILSGSASASAQSSAAAYDTQTSSSSRSPVVNGSKTSRPPAEVASAVPTSAAVPDLLPDEKVKAGMSPTASPKDKPGDSYIVGIADDLQISVWKEPDLSGQVVVRPDGMITVPVVDDVYVVGMTTKQVQDILTEKLKPIVSDPQVTVIVRTIRSRKVYLVGQIGHAGAVSLTGHETVLQVLAESGGPSPYAKADKIYILRKAGDHQEKLAFNYKKAVKGGDPNADFQLENGDVIVVP